MKKKIVGWIVTTVLVVVMTGCSTRGLHENYQGATEQRLITQSLDALIQKLPEEDFLPLKGETVYLECHFIEDSTSLAYAKERLKLELKQKYGLTLFDEPEAADKILKVFFNAIGTDKDDFGLQTPEFIIPGVGATFGIDIITLDMFHGVSELYYYIVDNKSSEVVRGDRIHSIIRTDKLSLPIISIPINTLD